MTDIVERLREQVRTRTLPMWLEISDAADEIERLRTALLALSRPDGFVRATIKKDRQARIDYARAVLGDKP